MERKLLFFGTPLNRSIDNDQHHEDNHISNRRARLNNQQIVRDSQGRQRFHGAFTGGFSAGYFNTVDSTAGFQPRQFISHRGNKRQDGSRASFTHKPEDYMDEEDLGEFGIAPRKVRVCNQYSNEDDLALGRLLRPVALSIGEKILKRLTTSCSSNQCNYKTTGTLGASQRFTNKDNFHGLGYKPLEVSSKQSKSTNPLTAILNSGKRLKISGEAFGQGVLDDDDEDYLTTHDAYGYDDIGNYEFERKSKYSLNSSRKLPSNQSSDSLAQEDHSLISGFILAKNINAIQICDNFATNNPLPSIPDNWRMPTRTELYIPPLLPPPINQQLDLKSRQSSSSFNQKFTSGSQTNKTDIIEPKAGLVLYTDLKAHESKAIGSSNQEVTETQITKASIVRKKLEWRPCSLLCKHFNVPNPYSDNLYVGVKPLDIIEQHDLPSSSVNEQQQQQQDRKEIHREFASLELRRLIFDVTFTNYSTPGNKEVQLDEDGDDSEDEPQVVEIMDMIDDREQNDKKAESNEDDDDDGDPDVLVVPVPKLEPEVIVLSSSSSSSSPQPHSSQQPSRSSSPTQLVHGMHGKDESHLLREPAADIDDAYGPPLPPTLRTLIDLDRTDRSHHSGSRQQRKKNKKHKKSKRNSK